MNYPGGIDLVISILKIGELSLKTSQNLVGLMMEEGGDYKPRNPFGLWKPALARIQRIECLSLLDTPGKNTNLPITDFT